jgi:hypothetical protein
VWRGVWSAQAPSADSAVGSWAILNTANQIVQQGTWAAQKSARGWEGSWSARLVSDGARSSQTLSGTWETAAKDLQGRTLIDLLLATLARDISGTWVTSGRLKGGWTLKGSPD